MDRIDGVKPTEFMGIMYRSRTEARWAVFFDRLAVKCEYELKRFKRADGRWYTPDFYIVDFDTFVEDKPENQMIILEEADKALALYEEKHARSVWHVMGSPSAEQPSILDFSIRERFAGIVDQYQNLEAFIFSKHIRAKVLEDRRDDFRYWLMGIEDWYFETAIAAR